MSWRCRIYNLKRSDKECERKHQYSCLTDEQQSCKEKRFVKCGKAGLRQNTQICRVFLKDKTVLPLLAEAIANTVSDFLSLSSSVGVSSQESYFLPASVGVVQPAAIQFDFILRRQQVFKNEQD